MASYIETIVSMAPVAPMAPIQEPWEHREPPEP
jgi:hypothetical protein